MNLKSEIRGKGGDRLTIKRGRRRAAQDVQMNKTNSEQWCKEACMYLGIQLALDNKVIYTLTDIVHGK